ncbi:XrtY-associated glycosyltransferase XYAG1 [Parafilimonas sp.]|uniref:XrtY-associated glycosyltransferase XYAG1 n=1 Tax=Parafilimonas sp. TaxID=1969739 RepID=UPI003F82216A
MKILHLVPSYKPAYIYGGPVESIAHLCETLTVAGEDITVYTTTANGNTELEVDPGKIYLVEGVKVIYFKRQTKDPLHFSIGLLKCLYKNGKTFDVVHIHSWWNMPGFAGLFICKKKRIKVVLSPRGMLSDYIIRHSNSRVKQFAHQLFGKSLLSYSYFHATAASEMEECRRVIPGWKGMMISNINNLPQINIIKKQNPVFTLLFLSRIHPKKGLELLFQAIARINVPVHLQIAGSGDETYISSLKQKAADLGITGKLQWIGWKERKEKFDVLMQADVFVLPSYNENFGNVVIEALHAGTPVLVTEGVALSAFVKEHGLGWVCKTEPTSIQDALEAAMQDKAKRCAITQAAPGIVEKYFSPEVLIKQYRDIYREVVNLKMQVTKK